MSILLLSIGLSMDVFAAALSIGLILKHKKQNDKYFLTKVVFMFGATQGVFYALGVFLGGILQQYFLNALDYVSFTLLLFISLGMFYDFLKKDHRHIVVNLKSLMIISLSTNADTLAAGVAYSNYGEVLLSTIVISVVTGIFTYIGIKLGEYLSKIEQLKRYSLLFGSIILFILALECIM